MNYLEQLEQSICDAAVAIQNAEALLIGAGAGMGVDSGLPDFRGDAGFWKAYPPFRGRRFSEMSTPHWFQTDPQLAWGFFGHRYHLYRAAKPHAGFQAVNRMAERMSDGYFVFTSNVDGQFQRAGFPADKIVERHGSIHHLQCVNLCTPAIWAVDELLIDVDPETIRTRSELPKCLRCGGIARPNILMFGDYDWQESRCAEQYSRYQEWLNQIDGKRIVAIEFGAGLAIPTVRMECESQAGTLIRVNPRDSGTDSGGISIPLGALAAMERLERKLALG